MATLENNLRDLATAVATEFKLDRASIGDLSSLTTSSKASLVAAINEIAAALGGAGATIDDETISALSVWSSSKTDDELDSRVGSAVTAAVAALVDGAPADLDTLREIADALGNDADLAATLTTSIATKASSSDLINGLALKVDASAVGDTDVDLVSVFEAGLE